MPVLEDAAPVLEDGVDAVPVLEDAAPVLIGVVDAAPVLEEVVDTAPVLEDAYLPTYFSVCAGQPSEFCRIYIKFAGQN